MKTLGALTRRRPSKAAQKREAVAVLTDRLSWLLIEEWAESGRRPIPIAEIRAYATRVAQALADSGTQAARKIAKEILAQTDERTHEQRAADELAEVYMELTGECLGRTSISSTFDGQAVDRQEAYDDATEEHHSKAVIGFAEDRKRQDSLDDRWFGSEYVEAVRTFNAHRTGQAACAVSRLNLPLKPSGEENIAIVDAVDDWAKAENNLLRESLAGNEEGGTRDWASFEKLTAEWHCFLPIWMLAGAHSAFTNEKSIQVSIRSARGKSMRVDGKVIWKAKVGRPRSRLIQGPNPSAIQAEIKELQTKLLLTPNAQVSLETSAFPRGPLQ